GDLSDDGGVVAVVDRDVRGVDRGIGRRLLVLAAVEGKRGDTRTGDAADEGSHGERGHKAYRARTLGRRGGRDRCTGGCRTSEGGGGCGRGRLGRCRVLRGIRLGRCRLLRGRLLVGRLSRGRVGRHRLGGGRLCRAGQRCRLWDVVLRLAGGFVHVCVEVLVRGVVVLVRLVVRTLGNVGHWCCSFQALLASIANLNILFAGAESVPLEPLELLLSGRWAFRRAASAAGAVGSGEAVLLDKHRFRLPAEACRRFAGTGSTPITGVHRPP